MDVSVDRIKPGYIVEFTDKTSDYCGGQAVILRIENRLPFVHILTGKSAGIEGNIGGMPHKIVSNGDWDV